MAKKYGTTYDDLLRDMEASNITFSDADLNLAKANPDVGYSILNNKIAYGQATTDEERTALNQNTEHLRQLYGNYTAGVDGTGYQKDSTYAPQTSPYTSPYQDQLTSQTDKLTNYSPYTGKHDDKISDLTELVTNPEQYTGTWGSDINGLIEQLNNRGPYSSQYQPQIDSLNQQIQNRDPYKSEYQDLIDSLTGQIQNRDPYNSKYQSLIDSLSGQIQNRDPYKSQYEDQMYELVNQLLEREDFSYNPAADPSYQAYSEKYRNAGNQAMQNALGSAAAMNGGQLSSYALTSAQQAQNNYAAQMSDMIPQLQQLAYGRYQDEGADMRQNLATLMSRDDQAYNRYMDEGETMRQNLLSLLSQDELAYGRWQDEGNALRQNLSDLLTQDQLKYGRYQDEGNNLYQKLNSLLNQDELAYGRYQDEGNNLRQNLSAMQNQDDREYSRYQDQLTQNQNALLTLLEQDERDYGRYMDQLGIDQSLLSTLMQLDNTAYNRHQDSQTDALNRWQLNYGVDRDKLSDQRYEDDKRLEQERYDQSLALDQDDRDYNRTLDKAQTLGSVGSFDTFRELGYSDEEIQSLANAYAKEQARKVSGNSTPDKPQNSNAYDSVLKKATNLLKDGSMEDAESYLNNMVDNEYITVDEAVYIYDVVLGGSPVMEELVPTSYEEFVSKTGNSGIMSAREFEKAQASSAGRTAGYKNYQDYLSAMYEKYK